MRDATNDAQAGGVEATLAALEATVRAVLRRKSGMSLRDDDRRADNLDALELVQDVMARLWERLVDPAHLLDDPASYAATVTHNAWSDHLRRRYPLRASLRNRLRYFLNHQAGFATWPGQRGETLTGLHAWRLAAPSGDAMAPGALLRGERSLPRGSVPRKHLDRFEAPDWHRLLSALYQHTGGPVELDDLVSIVAALLDLKEDRTESLDEDGDDAGDAPQHADERQPTPEEAAEMRSLLRQLWGAIGALKWDYRCCYLLNLPGPGKLRAEIELFVLHGIADMTDIDAVLALRQPHYAAAFDALALTPMLVPLDDAASAPVRQRHFAVLWPHLPLADLIIARMLTLAPQQVINRRMLALRELARMMGHQMRRQAPAGRT